MLKIEPNKNKKITVSYAGVFLFSSVRCVFKKKTKDELVQIPCTDTLPFFPLNIIATVLKCDQNHAKRALSLFAAVISRYPLEDSFNGVIMGL